MGRIVSRTFGLAIAALSVAGLAGAIPNAAVAASANETWLACSGSLAAVDTSRDKPMQTTEPSQRILLLDDAGKNLYQYAEDKNALSIILAKTYTPGKITWGTDMSMTNGMTWEGTLDRAKMDLKIVRDAWREKTHMTWTEKCQPTQPRAVGTSLVATN